MAQMERTISDQDMVNILEGIIRNSGNDAARIAAMKHLRELDAGTPAADDGFGALDGDDEVTRKRNLRMKTA
jgi:hypothetical protein